MDFHFLVMEKSWKIKVEKEGAPWLVYVLVPEEATSNFQPICCTEFQQSTPISVSVLFKPHAVRRAIALCIEMSSY